MDFQSTLFAPDASDAAEPVAPELTPERTLLSHGAWLDVQRNWLAGADDVFAALVSQVPWRAERRAMYDRVVDVPRLLHTYVLGEALPHPMLEEARDALSAHYLPELGEPFVSAGCCYYRDGRDSVAWHGDTIGRGKTRDTMVAIVSLGDPRKLALRPRGGRDGDGGNGGAEAMALTLGHGDLVVMGGSCQRTWEHAVPKVAAAGPRISVQFRPLNVF